MHVLPNRECPPRARALSFWLLIFFNQSVGSIACYFTRQIGTLNAINHPNQRCHGTSDPQQQIVIKMLWYQWGIVCKQSNVQIVLLNNPLLFSLHPTSLSEWKPQLIILTCPAMIQRWSSGLPADTVGWFSMSRLPADHPWVTVRHPDGDRRISVRPPVGFFLPITPQIPTGSPSGGRQATGRRPTGCRPMS